MTRARQACLYAAAVLAVPALLAALPSGVMCVAAIGFWLYETPPGRQTWGGP